MIVPEKGYNLGANITQPLGFSRRKQINRNKIVFQGNPLGQKNMQPEQIYLELRQLAEKLGILVSEHNLRKTGIHVKSGLCKVRDKTIFVMDKHETIYGKNRILASCLREMDHENIYVVPTVRALLDKPNRKKKESEVPVDTETEQIGATCPGK